ncbi:hypothetical protein RDWZM_002249 [Blomia tropicalis]|uniref:CWH43-like N-terminal domain-containing protein n=1 Tax=Blomia tropicalis TaxID=40697 RepID=A0A9Q0RRD5_BLOTA|nr:hypothetical protein RDWZM_002249 [Blomia tropicalis]
MWIYKGSKDCCNGVRNFNWVLVPPIAFSLTVPYFIFSCYIQGALNSHYNGLFPLVSDTGNYIPEAANFSVIITGIGLFFLLSAITRFFQHRALLRPRFRFVQMVKEARARQKLTFNEIFLACCCGLGDNPNVGANDSNTSLISVGVGGGGGGSGGGPKVDAPVNFAFDHRLSNVREHLPTEMLSKYNRLQRIIKTQLILGIIICLAAIGTGAFRFADSLLIHNAVASGVFMASPLYMAFDLYLSWYFCDFALSRSVLAKRAFINVVSVFFVILFGSTMSVLTTSGMEKFMNPRYRLFWPANAPLYYLRMVNAFAEWAFLLTLSPYVATFVSEFQRLKFRKLRLNYNWVREPGEVDYKQFWWHPAVPSDFSVIQV